MAAATYLRQGSKLIATAGQPYASEDFLQKLFEVYPELLAGDQAGSEPRRCLLINCELMIASEDSNSGRWSVDRLFVDQDAVPRSLNRQDGYRQVCRFPRGPELPALSWHVQSMTLRSRWQRSDLHGPP